jgi:hypothetical protein
VNTASYGRTPPKFDILSALPCHCLQKLVLCLMEIGNVLIVEPGKPSRDGSGSIVARHSHGICGLILNDHVIRSHHRGSVGVSGRVESTKDLHPPSSGKLTIGHVVKSHVPACSIIIWLTNLHSIDELRIVSHSPALSNETNTTSEPNLNISKISSMNICCILIERYRQK